jgi:hypothetical protein
VAGQSLNQAGLTPHRMFLTTYHGFGFMVYKFLGSQFFN